MAKKKKKTRPITDEEKPERVPHVVWYDEEGVEIGDDGYPMTPIRRRMHRIFNAMFIWAIIAVALGVFCTAFAYAQNQDFSMQGFDITVTGGTQVNGYSFGTMLRYEGIFCLLTAIVSFFVNLTGFHWMYDQRSQTTINIFTGILCFGSLIYLLAALFIVHVPDPVSIVNFVLSVLIFNTMQKVKTERPLLKKAKRKSKVVKK